MTQSEILSITAQARQSVQTWLMLALAALTLSGIYSIIIVVARTPHLTSLLPFNDIFHTSLIVHVDLLVVGWFLSAACLFWQWIAPNDKENLCSCPYSTQLAQGLFGAGMLIVVIAPFFGSPEPFMNNYIPMLDSRLFGCGILMLLGATSLAAIGHIGAYIRSRTWVKMQTSLDVLRFGSFASALIFITAMVSLAISYHLLQGEGITGEVYYDTLFWVGGHVLQFTHTELMLISWIILCSAIKLSIPYLSPNATAMLLRIGVLALFFVPYALYTYAIYSFEMKDFFTKHMIHLGGVAPMILAPLIAWGWLRSRKQEAQSPHPAYRSALCMSVILFGVGGIFGMLIDGPNVRIPAHYHGSIIGISIAYMGMCYVLLPKLGFADVSSWRKVFWQPIIYGCGQLMHISGLFFSGGYEVLRKTPGEVPGGETGAKIFMGIMGAGGLFAIIGGVIFIIIMIQAMRQKSEITSTC
jgi:cytochrome c oxidase subunit I